MHHKQGERRHVELPYSTTSRPSIETPPRKTHRLAISASCAALLGATMLMSFVRTGQHAGGSANRQQKPNILFIMGDDIGWMQPSIYHRGLMVGETPNIDRIGNEGAMFMTLLRRAELHGRAATPSSPA